jgi:hypothetical protein
MSFLLLTGRMPPNRDAALALAWQPSSSAADTIAASEGNTIRLEAWWDQQPVVLACQAGAAWWCLHQWHHWQQAAASKRHIACSGLQIGVLWLCR